MEWRVTAADQFVTRDATLVTRVLVPICGCVSNTNINGDPLWFVFKIDAHLHLQCPVCGVAFCQSEPACSLKVEI